MSGAALEPSPASSPASVEPLVAMAACERYDADLVRAAVERALMPLGGIGAFVAPGATVLVKPNLLSPRPPEEALTTHPALVAAVVRLCLEAGAARVWVGDSCAGEHAEEELWAKTGMRESVPAAGGELKTFRGPVRADIGVGGPLPVPAWLDEVDAIISLPKLKTHLLTTMTCAVKNMYGMVVGQTKALRHADHPSPRRMSAFLVDVCARFRPALSIVDAVWAMEGEGPANGEPVHVGLILAGADPVALDSVCARLIGVVPEAVPTTVCAVRKGLGVADADRIRLAGDLVNLAGREPFALPKGRLMQRLPEPLFLIGTLLLRYRPHIQDAACVRCGICAETCSRNAIHQAADGRFTVQRRLCILCMCCMEACPHKAITFSPVWQRTRRLLRAVKRFLRR